MRPVVYPYKMGSKGATLLARALGARKVYPNRNYRPRPADVVINWGSGRVPNWADSVFPYRVLNHYHEVANAGNKFTALRLLEEHGSRIPRYTMNPNEAKLWCTDVMVRTVLRGHSGAGCIFVPRDELDSLDDFPATTLFVEYIPKRDEYRVHVFQQEVILVQHKRKRRESDVDYKIRSHNNGWVYCRNDAIIRSDFDDATTLAIQAVESLGLDFGAVDIIYNSRRGYYVLEVNTAPGLTPSTAEVYRNAIQRIL